MPTLLQSAVAEVLQKVLGAFIKGIDAEGLNLGLWNGDVKLQGLELNTAAFEALRLPVRVVGGKVGEVHCKVPNLP